MSGASPSFYGFFYLLLSPLLAKQTGSNQSGKHLQAYKLRKKIDNREGSCGVWHARLRFNKSRTIKEEARGIKPGMECT
ncbi:unnamed protein product [Dovyalis caffra]|uniref:Secreted protein n=1 Tax=Dovyalis caffra TaxID=77055 RepID=A0AAV1QZ91_9ROSI|nr:unnamed protein product [Dovyalis caffra]